MGYHGSLKHIVASNTGRYSKDTGLQYVDCLLNQVNYSVTQVKSSLRKIFLLRADESKGTGNIHYSKKSKRTI